MMQREFSKREKILLLILVVLILSLLYYILVYKTIAENISAVKLETQDIQSELAIENARLSNMSSMQAELDSFLSGGELIVAEIPDYDNIQLLMKEFNQILSQAISYNLTLSNIDFTQGIARRPVNMTFSANSYIMAKEILANLVNCKYRNLLGALNISAPSGNLGQGVITVKLDITFYEMYKME